MRKILWLAAMASTFVCGSAAADTPAAALEKLGLIGTWATYCTPGMLGQLGLRVVFAEPPGGAPTYTTVSSDGAVATTVRSTVLEAMAIGNGQLKLKLRITGGDRGGEPLPDTMTNTFEQVIEKVEGSGIRVVGFDPRFIQKCPDQ